ncbi:unnamed protein product [Musa acuminata subsp. malaccensis]|uniref:(wild Malaysian banana) hypothetical protein n=1 Tax=Musa acuminata subsp. malaccensis TaxID=214687 RepID=A0A804HRM0_MUSAM|nr:unnamed protein product [Musa acuminata subsp. malaccensis]
MVHYVILQAVSLRGEGSTTAQVGEWDVNNPASADGFTIIFNKARDEKKTMWVVYNQMKPINIQQKRKWFCCG